MEKAKQTHRYRKQTGGWQERVGEGRKKQVTGIKSYKLPVIR